jgi:hypothetical protein
MSALANPAVQVQQASRVQHDREEQWPQRQRQIEEYHSLLTKNFLLDYLMPTFGGGQNCLRGFGYKDSRSA